MSYNDEALKAKLSTLNETQDSIVSVSQWITFHKRHADRIASYWLTRLRDSPPPKRLNYVYLVNDIVQNARARKRTEFPDAFSPLMPEAIQTAYRSANSDIQNKIRRVVEVWRSRGVFEAPILTAIEARIEDTDKTKGSTGKKTLLGNSLFNSTSGTGMPKELETVAPLQTEVTKAILTARPFIDTAQNEYTKLVDAKPPQPSPPVHAAQLTSLMRALATAESSVSASIKARQALITDLERILDINRSALAKDEQTYMDLSSRRTSTEAKKREVEDSIMRGLSSLADDDDRTTGRGEESGRPDVEELTPEPDDFASFTEVPAPNNGDNSFSATTETSRTTNPALQGILAGFGDDALNHAPPNTRVRSASSSSNPGMNGASNKRRKMSHEESAAIVPDLGEMGMEGFGGYDGTSGGDDFATLDDDVSDLFRQEGR